MLSKFAQLVGAGDDRYEGFLRAGMFGTPVLLVLIEIVKTTVA